MAIYDPAVGATLLASCLEPSDDDKKDFDNPQSRKFTARMRFNRGIRAGDWRDE